MTPINRRLALLGTLVSLVVAALWPGQAAAHPATVVTQPPRETRSGSLSEASATFQWPVQGGRITQRYSSRHPALDIGLPYGSPVYASAAGTVRRAGWSPRWVYGIRIELVHPNGYVSTYSHLSSILVQPGQVVEQGTRIGLVGSTGKSTGPHLHFELYQHGRALNPLSLRQRNVVSQPELSSALQPSRLRQVSWAPRRRRPRVTARGGRIKPRSGRASVAAPGQTRRAAIRGGQAGVRINRRRFSIQGLIDRVGDRPIVIAGHTIQIDYRLVQRLQIRGPLDVGMFAKVRGVVLEDGTLAAEEVKAEAPRSERGRGKGRGRPRPPRQLLRQFPLRKSALGGA